MMQKFVTEECLRAIELSCRSVFPKEACGIVDEAGNWHECKNVADTPEDSFTIEAFKLGQLAATVGIKYIVHSHTKEKVPLHICTPSLADVQEQAKSQTPWLIVGCNGKGFMPPMSLPPEHNPIYEGRAYVYGLQDCGTLLWDFFHYEFGVELKVPVELSLVPRRLWANSVIQIGELNGFVMQDMQTCKLQRGDVLLVSLFGERRNHGVLYLGDGQVLNQGEVSAIAPLEMYQNHIEGIYRYGGFC